MRTYSVRNMSANCCTRGAQAVVHTTPTPNPSPNRSPSLSLTLTITLALALALTLTQTLAAQARLNTHTATNSRKTTHRVIGMDGNALRTRDSDVRSSLHASR